MGKEYCGCAECGEGDVGSLVGWRTELHATAVAAQNGPLVEHLAFIPNGLCGARVGLAGVLHHRRQGDVGQGVHVERAQSCAVALWSVARQEKSMSKGGRLPLL